MSDIGPVVYVLVMISKLTGQAITDDGGMLVFHDKAVCEQAAPVLLAAANKADKLDWKCVTAAISGK